MTPAKPINASVILCTKNRAPALRETLASLEKVMVPEWIVPELVVVDNGSSDDTPQVVSQSGLWPGRVRPVFHGGAGKASALNRGVQVAAGTYLAFIDDDVHPDANWLVQLLTPLFENRLDAVCGQINLPPHLVRPWMLPQHHWVMASTGFLDPNDPSSAVGANWAYRAEVTQKVPLYDEELSAAIPVYEDTLYSMQLKQAGYRLGMATTAIASHHFQPNRLTREAFIKRVSNDGKGRAYLAWNWKHEDLGRPYSKYLALRWRLLCLRIMRRPKALGFLPLWEFELVEQISFLRTYLRLRNYEPAYTRFGLLKIRSGHAAETFAES